MSWIEDIDKDINRVFWAYYTDDVKEIKKIEKEGKIAEIEKRKFQKQLLKDQLKCLSWEIKRLKKEVKK